jgi:hypothetical protein
MNAPDASAAVAATSVATLPRLAPSIPAAGQRVALPPLAGSADALALAQLALQCMQAGRLLAVIAADALAAQRLADEIPWFAPGVDVALFPDWETLPYDPISPHQDLISARLASLYRLAQREARVVVTAVSTAMLRLPPPSFLAARAFFLKQGQRLDVDKLRAQLALAGYAHVTQVVSPGEYSVRGGPDRPVPMGAALPYRLDLFGDELEGIKTFDADTQRTSTRCPRSACCPRASSAGRRGPHALSHALPRGVRRRPVALGAVQGREQRRLLRRHRVLPAAVLRRDGGVRRLPARERGGRLARRRARRGRALLLRGRRALPAAARRQGAAAPRAARDRDAARRVRRPAQALRARRAADAGRQRRIAAGRAHGAVAERVGRSPRGRSAGRAEAPGRHARGSRAGLRRERGPARDDAPVLRAIRPRAAGPRRLRVVRVGGPAERAGDLPAARRVRLARDAHRVRHRGRALRRAVRRGRATRAAGRTSTRWCATSPRCASATRSCTSSTASAATSASRTSTSATVPSEFLELVYANDAKLYVPVSGLHQISRYSGASPENAPLHELGSGQWEKAKRRAAQKAHDTAAEL